MAWLIGGLLVIVILQVVFEACFDIICGIFGLYILLKVLTWLTEKIIGKNNGSR